MKDYQRAELRAKAEIAKDNLASACPLLEDEVALAAYSYILELEDKVAELEKQLKRVRDERCTYVSYMSK